MDVALTLKHTSNSVHGRTEIHLCFPDEKPPYHTTNVLPLHKPYNFKLHNNGCVFLIAHLYRGGKLLHRLLLQPTFNVRGNLAVSGCSFEYEIELKAVGGTEVINFVRCDMGAINRSLYSHIDKNYNLVTSLQPAVEVLRRKHSLKYEIELEGKTLYLPYVTLCTRGFVTLQNINYNKLEDYKSFFRKSLNNYFHNVKGRVPSDFVRMSQFAAKENDHTRMHSIMIQITDYFSHLMHSRIEYTSDYNATGRNDYVGINLIEGVMRADCEDIASAAYDTMRIFRKMFPATLADIATPSTTLPYHVSAWLSESRIMLCQGAVLPHKNEAQINHVWVGLLLNADVPMVVVEGTRDSVDYSKYKHLIRSWMMIGDRIQDNFMVNPNNNTYGLPMSDLVYERNARHVYDRWAKNTIDSQDVTKSILFAGSIQTETHTFMENVLKK